MAAKEKEPKQWAERQKCSVEDPSLYNLKWNTVLL